MRQAQSRSRGAFTLLEVVLAISLSVVLLGALYVALNMNYTQARIGREIMDETVVTRSIVNRISQDIIPELPPIDPRIAPGATSASGSGSSKSGSGGSGGSTSASGTGSANSNSSSNTNSYSTNNSSNSSNNGSGSNNTGNNSSSSSSSATVVIPNAQVYGDQNNLVLCGRSVPQDLTMPPGSQPTLTTDLRRVTYWVIPGKGLARLEELQVTGGTALVTPPSLPPVSDVPDSLIVAPEVTSIVFEYFDGTNWQESWDGTTVDPSGNTTRPIGPPAAIAFTVTLAIPVQGPPKTRNVTYRHVVPIQTANNFAAVANSSANGSSTTPGSSQSSSGSSSNSTTQPRSP